MILIYIWLSSSRIFLTVSTHLVLGQAHNQACHTVCAWNFLSDLIYFTNLFTLQSLWFERSKAEDIISCLGSFKLSLIVSVQTRLSAWFNSSLSLSLSYLNLFMKATFLDLCVPTSLSGLIIWQQHHNQLRHSSSACHSCITCSFCLCPSRVTASTNDLRRQTSP